MGGYNYNKTVDNTFWATSIVVRRFLAGWDCGFISRCVYRVLLLCLFVVCFVGSCSCDQMITRSEEHYQVCVCVRVCMCVI